MLLKFGITLSVLKAFIGENPLNDILLSYGNILSGPVRKRAILIGQKAGQRFRFKVRPIFFQIFFTSHARNP
ncbi:MAG: hypothetical protein ABSF52_04765, partial [Syntrophobacteraceae bacterium]